MSSPKFAGGQATRFVDLALSRARGPAASTVAASSRRTTTTPSSSATITSPGRTRRSGADDGRLDVAGGLLDRALGADGLGPDRKAHRGEFGDVAHARVDDQSANAVRDQAGGEQFAEVAVVAGASGCHDQDVAGLAPCSTATWIDQLSPGATSQVSALPATRTGR